MAVLKNQAVRFSFFPMRKLSLFERLSDFIQKRRFLFRQALSEASKLGIAAGDLLAEIQAASPPERGEPCLTEQKP
ncbi:MAG: hypothetical protein HY433_03845 [Candidatus Liptonbacteria bacterium]|nr:hypothetical protein [Candidatus Liptonbacteria bacterium]